MIHLHQKQKKIVQSKARFKVIRAGRRSGKTTLEIEEMLFEAVSGKDRYVFYLAPTQSQARDIIWEALKSRIGKLGKANEARLEMRAPTQEGGYSIIYVAGWENRENFRGKKAHLIVFDELDTMRNFQIAWQEIFRPALMDTQGKATFIGTPKKENPNLRRLEKIAETDSDYETFHFTTKDNPFVPDTEIEKAKQELDYTSFRQEILAEYVESTGALFNYSALVDVFSNTVDKENSKYLIVDIADDGSDKTIFSFWEGLEEYRRESFERLNTENIIDKIKEYASQDKIPYSHIAVDAIGVGAGVASSSRLDGIIGYKSSYSPIKTDMDIVRLPNVNYTKEAPLVSDYKNLRSQCVFTLADYVNNHKIASRVDGIAKELVIEELSTYQDISKGDGKRMATTKEEVKESIGRSPDCFIAGTKIQTPKGIINIEELEVGDDICTPFGDTKIAYIIEKETDKLYTFDNLLTGTGNHRIFSGSLFSPLDNYIMRVYTYYINNNYNKYIWKILSLLSIKIKNIGFRGLVDISTIAHTKMELDNKESHFTEKYGKTIIKKKSPKIVIYIMLTGILLIMTRSIWFALNLISIILSISKNILIHIKNSFLIILKKLLKLQGIGLSQKVKENKEVLTLQNIGKQKKAEYLYVKNVENNLNQQLLKLLLAPLIAYKSIIIELKNITKLENVSFAEMLLVSGSLNIPKLAQENVVSQVENIKVYSLTLEKHNVYFANNILVENCSDTWVMRMYFEVKNKVLPDQTEEGAKVRETQSLKFDRTFKNKEVNSSK